MADSLLVHDDVLFNALSGQVGCIAVMMLYRIVSVYGNELGLKFFNLIGTNWNSRINPMFNITLFLKSRDRYCYVLTIQAG